MSMAVPASLTNSVADTILERLDSIGHYRQKNSKISNVTFRLTPKTSKSAGKHLGAPVDDSSGCIHLAEQDKGVFMREDGSWIDYSVDAIPSSTQPSGKSQGWAERRKIDLIAVVLDHKRHQPSCLTLNYV